MSDQMSRLLACGGLVLGSALGLAGTFVPVASTRGVLWGLDGIALVVAAALLAIYYHRKGDDIVGAGFLVFAIGESLILATASMELTTSGPTFGAGAGLWAAGLVLLSLPRVAALWLRIVGVVAGVLFLIVAMRLFMGDALTALSQPLPFFAYPFLVATMLGWAWERYRGAELNNR